MRNIKILFKNKFKWKFKEEENYNIYYSCSEKIYNIILKENFQDIDINKVRFLCKNTQSFDNFIIDNKLFTLCVVDKLNSQNIYYFTSQNEIIISNDIYKILECKNYQFRIDEDSLQDTKISGYASQNKTIFKDIYSLQAGQFLFFQKKNENLDIQNYFKFYNKMTSNTSRKNALLELKKIEDNIFDELIERNKNKKILLALSGGLDSRYVLSSLLKRNFKNIEVYTYGHKNNYDSLISKQVASQLNLSWKHFETDGNSYKKIYKSDIKDKYWEFSGQGVMVPNLFFFESVKKIAETYDLNEITIVNGQAGDFITGDHLPNFKKEHLKGEEIIEFLYNKHFQLNMKMNLKQKLKKFYFKQISKQLNINLNQYYNYQDAAKIFELWEWQERQTKRVINMQKIYDFFNIKWELPLWHQEYINFWIDQPYEFKYKRNLFINYIVENDKFNIFVYNEKQLSKWLTTNNYITFIGKIIKVLASKYGSEYFYNFMSMFCKYGYMYSPYSFKLYLKKFNEYKDPLAFLNDDWIEKNQKLLK